VSRAPDPPPLAWSPDAVQAYCRRFGLSRAEAETQLAEENAQLTAAWVDYRRRRPNGTARGFALEQIEAAAFDALTTSGVPANRARGLARNARRRAEEHAP
jgi:hypothetical protein